MTPPHRIPSGRPCPRRWAALLLVGLGLGLAHAGAGKPLLRDRQQVVMLGDSLTEGEDPDGYVNTTRVLLAVLEPRRAYFIANAGKGGDTAVNMDNRLERDVLRFHPDWVTVSAGVNDINHGLSPQPAPEGPRGVPLPLFQTTVTNLVRRLQALPARVALFSGTVIQEDLARRENGLMEQYAAALRDIARHHDCLLVDTRRAFVDALRPDQRPGMPVSGVLTADGVHLRPEGSWLMARTLVAAWGFPIERIDRARPAVEREINRQRVRLQANLTHYAAANQADGLPAPGELRVVCLSLGGLGEAMGPTASGPIRRLERGLEGETTRQLRMRFHQDVVALKPVAVVWLLGACEDRRPEYRMSPIDTETHVARIARLAKGSGIRVTFGSFTPVNPSLARKHRQPAPEPATIARLNAWLRALCVENGYTFVDLTSPLAEARGWLRPEFTDDGWHPNAAGRAALRSTLDRAFDSLQPMAPAAP